MRPLFALLLTSIVFGCGGSDAPEPEAPANHTIVVNAQSALSDKVKAADAIIAKVASANRLSYDFARHATMVRRNAMLDEQAAKIAAAVAAKTPVPEGTLIVMAKLVDDLADDANTIQKQADEARAKALAAEEAAYESMVVGIVSAAASEVGAIDTWREASTTLPAKTTPIKTRGKVVFGGNDLPATWTEGLLPGDTTITLVCTTTGGGPATVSVDAASKSATLTKKGQSMTLHSTKPYIAHVKVTASTPNQNTDCSVTMETPRSADRPAPKKVDVTAITNLLALRDAAVWEYYKQSLALLATTTAADPAAGARLRGVFHVAGNELVNEGTVHAPATSADIDAFVAALAAKEGSISDLNDMLAEDATQLQMMLDAETQHQAAVSAALKQLVDATGKITAALK